MIVYANKRTKGEGHSEISDWNFSDIDRPVYEDEMAESEKFSPYQPSPSYTSSSCGNINSLYFLSVACHHITNLSHQTLRAIPTDHILFETKGSRMSGNRVRLVTLEHSIPDILSIPPADLPRGKSDRDEALRFSVLEKKFEGETLKEKIWTVLERWKGKQKKETNKEKR